MTASTPDREQAREWFRQLAAGEATPGEISTAAQRLVVRIEDEIDADDFLVGPLNLLGMADMQTGPGEFLYGPSDFFAWSAEFEEQLAEEERRHGVS